MNDTQFGLNIGEGTVNSNKDNRIDGSGAGPLAGTISTATLF